MLENITIKNFRSIQEISIDLPSNYIVLTGENNTGKTNILRAFSRLLQHKEQNSNPFLDYEKDEDCRNLNSRYDEYHLYSEYNVDLSIKFQVILYFLLT